MTNYPELHALAELIADQATRSINERAPHIKSQMPYKCQCVLEYLIEILERRV